MKEMARRILKIEHALQKVELPEVELHIVQTDGKLKGSDGDELVAIIRAGTSETPGKIFHRGKDERVEDFKKRAKEDDHENRN